MHQHLKTLGSAVIVYLVVAACSAPSNSQRLAGTGGTGATSSTGGAGGLSGGAGGMLADSGLDALADAMGDALSDAAADVANPVPDADAAPPSQVVNAPCDVQAGGLYYAEASFPGKLASELAGVSALLHYDADLVLGYRSFTNSVVYVADGKVATQCNPGGQRAASVDFFLP